MYRLMYIDILELIYILTVETKYLLLIYVIYFLFFWISLPTYFFLYIKHNLTYIFRPDILISFFTLCTT